MDAQKQPAYIEYLKDWCVDDHKLPPNETDQVQPIDRGLGRLPSQDLSRPAGAP